MRTPFFFSFLLFITSPFAQKLQICLPFMLLFQISSFSLVSGQCLNDQRSLLLQLNSTLTYDSSLSTKLVQWNQNIDCCNWNGVECDSFGHVIGLELDNEAISGGIEKPKNLISSSFLQLRTLSVLRLDGNDLSNTSLDFCANFRNLTVLSLSYCNLQGAFPEIIFQVSTLQHLDLSNNYELTGTIPEFPPGGSIRTLILSSTKFSGSLTDSIINLSNLSIIDVSSCNFSGQIPSTIRNLTNLVHLNFENNSFTGSIPIFRMLNKLEYINLSDNNLNGSLSSTHFIGLSNLQELYLDNNSLTGIIPTSLFSLPSLQILSLSDNKFSGQVNEFSTSNSNLERLFLDNNQLEGLIPKSLFTLEKLSDLYLSHNFFNGTIQLEHFQNLQNLRYLRLGNNHLSVNIDSFDSEFSSFPQLVELNLASNNLSRFPNLRNQTTIEELDLSDNNISGDIPSWIWEVGNGSLDYLNLSHNLLINLQTPYQFPNSLVFLDLNSNMLHGELPQGLLYYLDFSNNHFQGHIPAVALYTPLFFSVANNRLTGEIPIFLCNATEVATEVIDLSNNLLSGVLPPCLVQNFTALRVLNIGRNNISGNIPDTFSADCSLSTLDLSRNNLQGNIPPSLANCKSLQVMNVASNNISDTFPCILLNSSSLHVLVLRYNKFFGDIRCHGFGYNWSNLQILDIAFNSFIGFVDPGFISSLTGMKLKNSPRLTGEPLGIDEKRTNINYRYSVSVTLKGLELKIVKILSILTSIDFSNNKFRGVIPETFGELSSLYALNLSHNSFTGTIPKSLGNLTELESLSLSANHLTGNIPTELVRLTSLSFFDVSNNELVGRIPSGSQFDTFSAANYEGNLGLCGSLVNKSCDSNVPTETSTSSTEEEDFDWMFMLAGIGYAMGVALVVVPPLFSRRCGKKLEELQSKLVKLICPRY